MSRAKTWEVWMVDFGDTIGSEQGGRRPAVVVASEFHASFPIALTLVLPLTTRDRGLAHQVAVKSTNSGLERLSFARTEEITAVSERRLVGRQPLGHLDDVEADQVRRMVRRMIV
jgi:mRNA interferase MazF